MTGTAERGRRQREAWSRLTWLVVAMLFCAGCVSSVRVPAIDPTGQQIFLPQPAYTTIESPLAGAATTYPGVWPRPAFTQPPAIPACPELAPTLPAPVAALPAVAPSLPAAPVPTNLQDRLVVSPGRIVAPVNSEVILLAGICGPDGYYVTRQPIEWSLSQESVGQFVDVGEAAHSHAFSRSRFGPQKLSNDFAVTRTSVAARPITRGTPSPHDDVWLQRGQAWISVTSASQGLSNITAVATGAENWEQRRQLARIHWVDAEWELPSPAIVRAGTPHTMVTKVSRSSNGQPLANWTVQYELADGTPAGFGPDFAASATVKTDEQGFARVSLQQRSAVPGTTRVRVRILSPDNEDVPIEVGEGWATVTWSAPGLAIRVTGPQVGTPESTLSYRIQVTNPGDLPATNTLVTAAIPALLRFLNSEPPAAEIGSQVSWNLGTLAAGDSRTFEVNCRAVREGSVRFRVSAEADGIAQPPSDSVSTEILGQSLEVRFVDPPTTATVGARVSFNVEVTNIGRRELTGVVVVDQFDVGLEHAAGENSPIRRTLGPIAVGETKRIAVTFVPRQAGTLCHTIEATAAEGPTASSEACVTVAEPRRGIEISKRGPARAAVGEEVTFTIQVTNTGDAPLTDLRILDEYPGALQPRMTTEFFRHRHTERGMEWDIPRLPAGGSESVEIVYLCLEPGSVTNQVSVTTAERARDATSARLTISARAAVADPPTNVRRPQTAPGDEVEPRERTDINEETSPGEQPQAATPRPDRLQLEVTQTPRTASIGETVTYTIKVTNDRVSADRGVRVSFRLPDTASFVRFNSVSAELALRPPQEGWYQVEEIAEMRPGGSRLFRVEVRVDRAGTAGFQVEATSTHTSEPVTESIEAELG